MKLSKTIMPFLKKHGATMLSIAASVGVVVTAVETAKATTKAQTLIAMNKEETLTKEEIVKDCWRFYVPAAVVGAGTIACILSSNLLNKKSQKELMAAYVAVQQTYSAYRKKVAEEVGREAEEKIHKEAMEVERAKNGDVIRLFYDPALNTYYHATMAQVIEAAYDFNRELAINGAVSLNQWRTMLNAKELTLTPDGDETGWNIDQLIEEWDYYWMDFEYNEQTTIDGLECCCYAPFIDPVSFIELDEKPF